jgi:hypothetical protein
VISDGLLALIRAGDGLLMLLTLIWAWPARRRFFVSERWAGYVESSPRADRFHSPAVIDAVLIAWAACCAALIAGVWVVPAALLNLLLCRYFFVQLRWKGLLRGMGAPGFMSYWLAAVVFLLEYTARHAPHLRALALLVAQVDFALIIFSAGVYKANDGYARGEGMDYGMANPMWGYWPQRFRTVRPNQWSLNALNHLAWTTEIAAAVLMLIPQTRALGGLLITASFLFICTQIRLAWLTEMMMLCGFLFVPAGHLVDGWLRPLFPAVTGGHQPAPAEINAALAVFLWGYLALLPVAHAGLFYNFYARRRLPQPLQGLLERYTNFFGLIVWRVFSVDHLNFFVSIYTERRADGARVLLSRYGSWRALRYAHVAESIVVTTIFTTLKYYASNPALFETRLRRYARTVPCPSDCVLVFQYVVVRKTPTAFAHLPVLEYIVEPTTGSIQVHELESGFDPRAPAPQSVVHEGAVPGSYAPAPGDTR